MWTKEQKYSKRVANRGQPNVCNGSCRQELKVPTRIRRDSTKDNTALPEAQRQRGKRDLLSMWRPISRKNVFNSG